MTPQEPRRATDRAGKVAVAAEVTRLSSPSSTKVRPPAPPVLGVRLGAGIRLEQAELTPGLVATLRHAASMHNPEFYERQRMRAAIRPAGQREVPKRSGRGTAAWRI